MTTTQVGPEHTIDGLPPGPRWPRAAQTAWWAARPLSLMRYCRRRYGDVFTVRPYGFGNIVLIADPALIKEVFTGDRDVFAAGEANAAMSPVLGRHSLLVLDGDRHLLQRRGVTTRERHLSQAAGPLLARAGDRLVEKRLLGAEVVADRGEVGVGGGRDITRGRASVALRPQALDRTLQ